MIKELFLTPEPAAKMERKFSEDRNSLYPYQVGKAQFLAVVAQYVRKRDNPVEVKIILWMKGSLF